MRLLVHGLDVTLKGGIETFVLNMASCMSDAIVFDYVIEKNREHDSVKLPGNGETLYIRPKRKMLANLKDWQRLLNDRKQIDSAVYFNWYSMAWLFPAIMARLKGYRVIIHAHNNKLHNCGFFQKAMHSMNRQIQKTMKITRLTNSELSAHFFFGKKPAVMIYNAIDAERFAFNQGIRECMRGKLGIKNGQHVYGFAGRIAYQKNPLFLMDIFKEIEKIDNHAIFLVCGNGDLMSETKNRAIKNGINVLFTEAVSNIQDYYQAMDVFILPSRFEGLGIVLIEAQCCGLPCVASSEVIPEDARVTELLKFISLDKSLSDWARLIVETRKCEYGKDRRNYLDVILNSRFNIVSEAHNLERTLIED